jgi:hypothetical protein
MTGGIYPGGYVTAAVLGVLAVVAFAASAVMTRRARRRTNREE